VADHNTSDQRPPREAHRIGAYELIEKIGHGAVGVVYKARQMSVDRIVALKVLDPRYARNEKYVERFLREGRAAAKLDHVNIVRGIDAGKSPEGFYYFAMEYVDGVTLKRLLKRDGIIGEARAAEITAQIARALGHAAGAGFVHRDVKPENIILTKDGTAKLADLGLAKSASEDGSVTIAGQAMGTPMYISPEQAKGLDSVDLRSDLYSLGATLYHMVTGAPPFGGDNPTVIMLKHINEEPPPPHELNADLSEGLCHVLEKMLAKDPAARYQSADELNADLEAVAADLPVEITRTRKTESRKRAPSRPSVGRLVIGGAAVVAAACVCLVLLYKPSHEPIENPPERPKQQPQNGAARILFDNANEKEEAGDLDEAKKLYEQVLAAAPDEALSARAMQRIEQIGRKQAQAAEARRLEADMAALDKLEEDAKAATKQGDYGTAIRLIDEFKPDSRHEDAADRAKAILHQLRTERTQKKNELEANAWALLDEGKYDEARLASEELRNLGYEKRANTCLAEIEQALVQKARIARETHAKFWLEFADHLRHNRPDDARNLATEALKKPEFGDCKEEVEWDRKLMEHLQQIDHDAREGLKALDGKEFPIRSDRPEPIRNVTDDEFDIIVLNQHIRKRFDSLDGGQRFRLADHYWKSGDNGGALPRAAYYLCVTFDLADAGEAAQSAPAPDAARFKRRIELLTPESDAAALLARAVDADKQSEWEDVMHACEQLEQKYAATLTVQQNKEEIEQLKKKAEPRALVAGASKKLNARIEVLEDGRWSLTWDFSSKEQLADFRRGPKPPGPSGANAKEPRIVRAAVALKGIDIIAPDIFAGTPVEIRYKLRLVEEKAKDGYGRILLRPHEGRKNIWEFSFWNRLGGRDTFRSFHTTKSHWERPYRKPPPQRAWHQVKIEVTADYATARFDNRIVYDSRTVELPDGAADPAAKPDLSGRYYIHFTGMQPVNTWTFDDITIIGPVDVAAVKALAKVTGPPE